MQSSTKNKRCSFVRVVLVCFFVSAFVFGTPVYAADGEIVSWGDRKLPDQPLTNLAQIAAGRYHSLGLKQDGSIVAWGRNDYGQCTVPLPNAGFTAIAAGYSHSLGLKTDGSIVVWGDNFYGQCTVPSPNTDFTAIAGGDYYSLGLRGCAFDLAGDLNDNCKVDFRDFAELGNQWLQAPGVPSADIAPEIRDDFVDMLDLDVFCRNWLIDCIAEPDNPACVPE